MVTCTRHVFALGFILSALSGICTIFFNGGLNAAQGSVADASRDWATLSQATEMILLALVARYRPCLVRAVPLTAAAGAMALAGAILAGMGTARLSTPLLGIGVCAASLASAWAEVLVLVVCSMLPFRRMFVCLLAGNLAAIPIASVLSRGSYAFVLVSDTIFVLSMLGLGLIGARQTLEGLTHAESAANAEVTRPNAVLPLTHSLFIYIFVFCFAYGFALRYHHADGGLLTNWFLVIVLLAMTIYALLARPAPRADTLFIVAFSLLLGGHLLVLIDDVHLATPASVLLLCGNLVFCVLMSLALCAIASRSRSNALPTIAWGNAIYYISIEAGAQLGIAITDTLAFTPLAARISVAAMLAIVVLYTLLSIRDFGFDKTIAGVETDRTGLGPTSVTEIQYADRVEARCGELATQFGLTARESDVFRLLARGNNTLHIQQELGITKNTLKYHVRHVYEKAGVHSQQELIDLL